MNDRANDLRRSAAEADARAAESWERSDTDGFLSQWASGITADKMRLQADIEDAGGLARFPALFDLEGNFVPARTIEARWGTRWMVLNPDGSSAGTFLPYMPKRRSTLAKRGFVEGFVLRPARAAVMGGGTGLSGAASAYVGTEPTDNPWDDPAEVVTTDRWEDS